MKKTALSPAGARILRRIGTGAAAGGAAGYFVTPHISGYQDVEPARRASAVIDATLGGIVGGMLNPRKAVGPAMQSLWQRMPLKYRVGVPTAAGLGEMVPITMATQARTREAMEDMSQAGQALAQSGKLTSIPYNLQQLVQSPTARGAGVGMGAAGLVAILTGLLRRRNERELRSDRGRSGMVGADFLKYMLPAMVAGGVIGNMRNRQ